MLNTGKITVSICTQTYNHGAFIKQCLDGFIMQRTDFAFEILIHDDVSTDNTANIIREYQAKFPEIIKPIYQTVNQYSQGKNSLTDLLFPLVQGKYIAICEGDDYWTDPLKLQKQVDYLEANTHIAGCFHDVVNVNENSDIIKENYHISSKTFYNQRDCLTWGGAYATCSLVFRSIAIKKMPKWFYKACSDYALDLQITEFGDIAYINQNMAAYRIHKGGAWQGNATHNNLEATIYRYRMCLTNPKFKREYSYFFYKAIYERSYTIAKYYLNEKKWIKRIKYAWYCFQYVEPKNLNTFKSLGIQLIFPSYLKFRKLISNKVAK